MKIAIRFTLPFDDKLKEYFNSFEQMVVYQHDADEEVSRTHVHALVETSVSTDTLKNRLQKLIGYRLSKSDWAFSAKGRDGSPIEDRFITYMSKGKLQPIALKGFTQEQCDSYKGLWVEQSKPLRSKSDTKDVTNLDIARELQEYITKQAVVQYDDVHSKLFIDNISTPMMIEKCIDLHNKYNKTYVDHSLVRIIQTSWGLCYQGSKWRERLVQSVAAKLNINFSV